MVKNLKRIEKFRSRSFLAQLLSETSRPVYNPDSTMKVKEALE
jgi:hypothetical protein